MVLLRLILDLAVIVTVMLLVLFLRFCCRWSLNIFGL